MKIACAITSLFTFILGAGLAPPATAEPVKIVAAENFYGGIAHRIGGPHVAVTSIINSPDQDPHLFEVSPAVARQLSEAQIVIVNGAHYDPWIGKLLQAAPRPKRTVINAAALVATEKPGGNPHLWYDPATMPKVATALAAALTTADPDHAADYAARLETTLVSLARVQARVAKLRTAYRGQPVTATEPVFGPMAAAIGLAMRNARFQTAMMNDTEPSARDMAAFEDDLKQHKVKALIYNSQVSDQVTRRLLAVAKEAQVPVVPVTETQPADTTFADWMLSQLDALERALAKP
jgi:zinc/manganese transport system substrate-binding protein